MKPSASQDNLFYLVAGVEFLISLEFVKKPSKTTIPPLTLSVASSGFWCRLSSTIIIFGCTWSGIAFSKSIAYFEMYRQGLAPSEISRRTNRCDLIVNCLLLFILASSDNIRFSICGLRAKKSLCSCAGACFEFVCLKRLGPSED